MRIRIRQERILEADPEALKEKFPEEYAAFLQYSKFADDKDWVMECFYEGGESLFDLVDVEVYVD